MVDDQPWREAGQIRAETRRFYGDVEIWEEKREGEEEGRFLLFYI